MTPDQKRFCVHFFNSEGVPLLNLKHLLARNALLEHQVARLTRMLLAQVERNKITAENTIPPVVH